MSADVASARLEWADAYQGLQRASGDPTLAEALRLQLEAVTGELRRRVGGVFTLRELATEYERADVWAREVLMAEGGARALRQLALVEGAAFHLYSREAVDYLP